MRTTSRAVNQAGSILDTFWSRAADLERAEHVLRSRSTRRRRCRVRRPRPRPLQLDAPGRPRRPGSCWPPGCRRPWSPSRRAARTRRRSTQITWPATTSWSSRPMSPRRRTDVTPHRRVASTTSSRTSARCVCTPAVELGRGRHRGGRAARRSRRASWRDPTRNPMRSRRPAARGQRAVLVDDLSRPRATRRRSVESAAPNDTTPRIPDLDSSPSTDAEADVATPGSCGRTCR